ncbi:MAG: hypothetical protein JXA90_03545 [Planctomycetes bacterium]|nr:hypothetical protein [Planctomycetota bacterium]
MKGKSLPDPRGAGRPIALAIVCALPAELRGLRASLSRERPLTMPGGHGHVGRIGAVRTAVLATGVGLRRACEGTLALLRSSDRPGAVLSVGYGGALSSDLRSGDLVLAERVEAEPPAAERYEPDARLLEEAAAVSPGRGRIVRGTILTLAAPRARASEKRALGADTGASIADMETAGVARAAAEEGVPAVFVRAVVDEAGDDLPPAVDTFIDARGRPRILRIALALIGRPRTLASVLRLRSQSRRASAALSRFAAEFAARAAR